MNRLAEDVAAGASTGSVADVLFRVLVLAAGYGLLTIVCLVTRTLAERPSGGAAIERGERAARRRRDAARSAALCLGLSALFAAPVFLWPGMAVSISAFLLVLSLVSPLAVFVWLASTRPGVVVPAWLASACVLAAAIWLIGGSMVAVADVPDRLEQERTLVAMRRIGEAFERWRIESGLPSARRVEVRAEGRDEPAVAASPSESAFRLDRLPLLSAEALERRLASLDRDSLPTRDGWGHPLELRGVFGSVPRLAIRSPGRDGVFSTDSYLEGVFAPTAYDEDIVWIDGIFVREPE